MAFLNINHVGISGVCACVPPQVADNLSFSALLSEKEARKFVRATGIRERRIAAPEVCASDLACQAGKKLLDDMQIDRNSIDMLIFLTQTPDYNGIPPTAPSMQHRLGLSCRTGAFDLIMNCSGFVYGLSCAAVYARLGLRVLLLAGETLSRVFSPLDRTTALLFGDAGAAVLVERKEQFGSSVFSLNSDGAQSDAIRIPAGGMRQPATMDALRMREFADGSRRNDLQGAMNGAAVYDFTQREVVADILKLLEHAAMTVPELNYWFFHQANRMVLEMFAMELGIADGVVPLSLDRFGNTSTVSIPLGMAADFGHDGTFSFGRTLLSGFGGGLSWGSYVMDIQDCYIGKLENYRV